MDIPERLDFSECALFFNGELIGLTVGVEVEFNGKCERYADCRKPGVDEWSLISSVTGICRANFVDPGTVLSTLAGDNVLALPAPGESIAERYGELVIASLDTQSGYLFPRVLARLAWSGVWSFAAPHSVKAEFSIYPAADRVILRKAALQTSLLDQLPANRDLSLSLIEERLLSAISQKVKLAGGYSWSMGDMPELPGIRFELMEEGGGTLPYMRVFAGRFQLKFHSMASLHSAYTALMRSLPLATNDIYRIELTGCEFDTSLYPCCGTVAVKIWVKR